MAHQSWEKTKEARRARMSPAERAESEARSARLAAALRVGIAVRYARESAGVSQTELAARMGVAQSAVSRIEAGRSNITVEMLTRIATALGASLSVKLGGAEAALAS
jgi:ribosome-binding protein aMBF1 (putative translation factor)